jgi:1-acyl-sn-glycerol-3-phosphate acyltransferase
MVRRAVEMMLRFDLRRSFRRVCWVGSWPPVLPDGPIIAYANHHHFYDGHLAWLLCTDRLHRPSTLWMAEWDAFPFFAPVGTQPFPPDDPQRRAATVRRTARWFRERPSTMLVYFPGGDLRAPERGITFDGADTQRLARLYPEATWWPLALHATWHGDAHPTALLSGGRPHAADGTEPDRLRALWSRLRTSVPGTTHTLLDGRRSASERWNFSFLAPFFERYLK